MSDPQRILQIINQLSKIQQSNPESPQDLVKTYLSDYMDFNDLDDLQEQEKFEKACQAFESLFDCMQVLANDYKEKSKPSQKAPPSSSSQGKNTQSFDPHATLKFLQCIIKIQAWWKKEYTLRRLQKEADRDRLSMSTRKDDKNPDEAALKEFASQLANKKITPEGFFRICDSDYKQAVRVDVFKDQISKFGIQLSRGQISRLTMILDEDIEGTITREEFYNALEAYNVSGEKHKSMDGFSVYYQFEYRTLFKLIVELRMKDISFAQMFNACDVNDDQRIDIGEVRKFVEGLNPEFKQKELHALMNYIDIDKNGKIDRDEFIRQLTRGEQTYKQSLQLQKQNMINSNGAESYRPMSAQPRSAQKPQKNNFFDEEEVAEGDQAGFFDFFSSGPKKEKQQVTAPKGKQQPAQAKQDTSVKSFMNKLENEKESFKKSVVTKMESSGQSVKGFFTSLKGKISNGMVPLGTVLQHLELSHPNVALKEKYELIKDCITGQHVDYAKLEETLSKHSQSMSPSGSQTFSVITGNIVKRLGGNPHDSIRQFFKAQGISETDQLSELEFISLFSGRFSTLNKKELQVAFKSINIDMDGFILVSDLVEVLLSYTQNDSKLSLSTKDLSKLIPGIEAMSPRSRIEELVEYIIAELKGKNMVPLNAFKMAVTKDQNSVTTLALEQAFKKILPHVQSEVFSEAMNAFKLNGPRDQISRSDFEAVFNNDQKTYIPHSQSIGKKSDSAKKPTGKQEPIHQDESVVLIRKLDDAMLRQGLSPAVAFRGADLNHNNVVTCDELRESIKKFLPDHVLSLADLKKVMMAFDVNRNGMIEEEEFISLFEKARHSNVTIIESPQKQSRILSEAQFDGDSRKSRLPLKGNQGQQSHSQNQVVAKVDESSIAKVVSVVESKINLKKFFGELNLGSEGEILINNIARKFKTEKSNAGQGLLPDQYMGIIRYLDQGQTGVVQSKDLLKFCDQFCKQSNKTDVTLELKHIANHIEVQRRNKFTKSFFETTSSLKSNLRIKEVEVLSEFQKLFGISSSQGPTLFKHFDANKAGKELTLDDICRQIDVHRLVPVDPVLQKTQSSKLNPEGVVTKFVIRLIGMPQAKQGKLAQKIEEVVKQQKAIFYEVIFNILVTEYALLNNAESKAFFEYLKASSSVKNAIDIATYTQACNESKMKIKHAQEEAFEGLINQQFYTGLSKLRMNDLGFVSKNGLKEYFNTIPKQGYTQKLAQLLNIEADFQFPPSFSPAEYLNVELAEQLENCQFWVVLDVLARMSGSREPLDELLFKFIGILLDNVAPNKSSFSALQSLYKGQASISINNSTAFHQLMIKLYFFGQKSIKGQGFQHGEIFESCQNQFALLWQKLGNKPIQLSSDQNVLLQKINRHRAKLPIESHGKQQDDFEREEEVVEGDEGEPEQIQEIIQNVDVNLIKQIEKALKIPIEEAVDDKFTLDQMPSLAFQKIFLQINQNIDKKLIQQLALQIDFKKTGVIQMKNMISYLKQVPGKYKKEEIIQSLKEIEEPIHETLEQQEIIGSDEYSLEDFCDKIQNIINIPNKFNAVTFFYELTGYQGEPSLQGSKLISHIESLKTAKTKAQPQKHPARVSVKASESQESASKTKKIVKFVEFESEQQDLPSQTVSISKQLIQTMSKPTSQSLVQSALSKFNKETSHLKTQADFVKTLSVKGKDKAEVSQVHQQVQQMNSLTPEEKLLISFMSVDIQNIDSLNVDLPSFHKTMTLYRRTPSSANEIHSFLKRIADELKKHPLLQEIKKKIEQPLKKESIKGLPSGSMKEKNALAKSESEDTQRQMHEMRDILPKLREGLAKPINQNKLIKLFKVADGYISQYDLFEFINNDLNIKGPTEQLDVLAFEFDEFGQCELGADNFLELCEEFDIPFKMDLSKLGFERKEDVRTKIRENKPGEQLSILDLDTQEELVNYKLTEDDFFRGVPTILNSELAALVQAERLYNEVDHYTHIEQDDDEDEQETERKFYDKDFGPKFKGDKDGSRFALYCEGKPPKPQFIDPANIVWLRPHSYTDKKPQFVDDDTSSNEVVQGALGDCWLIGALSVIGSKDEYVMGDLKHIEVKSNFKVKGADCDKLSTGVYPPIFHMYRKKGLYVLRFFKDFQWRYVIVDDRLPCNKSSYKPYYATCTNLHELWVPLIEKAYAKLHGCYQALISGYIDDAIDEMTGLVSDKIKLHNQDMQFPHKNIKSADDFWNFLMKKKEEGCMMGCSSSGETEGQIKHEGAPCGILAGHAYALLDVLEIENTELERNRKTHRLLRVRNPWGKTEWNGKWSDQSEEMDLHADKIVEKIKEIYKDDPEEEFIPGKDDGAFMINYANWRDIYNNMFIIYDFPDSDVGIRCQSEWSKAKQNTGGTPASMDEKQIVNWAKNPQFLFAPKKDCRLFASLAQPDGRAQQKNKKYFAYPYVEVINPICLMIYELEPGKAKVERFKKERIPYVSIIRESREVALNAELKAGKNYVIVPSCKGDTDEGQFYLSLYFTIQIRDVKIKCLNDPSIKFADIAEETENYDVQPKWKKKLIQNRLKFMITGEDQDALNESLLHASGAINLNDLMKAAVHKKPDSPNSSKLDISGTHSNNNSFRSRQVA